MKTIDVNAAVGFWPLQPFPYQSLEELDDVFERNGVDEVWISAVESILFPEPDTHDFALFERTASFSRFRNVKTVNPLLANWRQSCEVAMEQHSIKALKIFPNYHDYPLNHAEVIRLCNFASAHDLPVLVALRVNDERNQPACLQMAPVSTSALVELANTTPATTFIALCAYSGELAALSPADNIMVDLSFIDGEDPALAASEVIPPARLVYGSHAPFLYVESAAYKIDYSDLPPGELLSIASGNIEALAAVASGFNLTS